MKEIDDILDEMRKHAGPKQLPHYRRLITGFVYRLEPLIRQLEADRDNWRRQALDEDARANAINSAANTNVDAKVYSESEMIEFVVKAATQAVQLTNEKFARPVGNAAKMLEALEVIRRDLWDLMGSSSESLRESLACKINATIRAALAAPARNCDIGTAEEQSVRMSEFCREQYKKTDGVALCSGCRFHGIKGLDCQFAWAQIPYESKVSDDQSI